MHTELPIAISYLRLVQDVVAASLLLWMLTAGCCLGICVGSALVGRPAWYL